MRTRAFTWIELVAATAIATVAGVLLTPVMQDMFFPKRTFCPSMPDLSHTKQLTLGVMMYAGDYDDRTPQANNWSQATLPYVKNTDVLHCHGIRNAKANGQYGHAMHQDMPG